MDAAGRDRASGKARSMKCTFEVGQVVQFSYPAANYLGVKKRWEQRRLLIEKVRDLSTQPLEAETLEADPLLDRGGVLVTGIDVDRGAERSFYTNAMREPATVSADPEHDLPPLRVTIVDETKPARVVELPDPRTSFCREFNRVDIGAKAIPMRHPVSRATCLASSNRRAE